MSSVESSLAPPLPESRAGGSIPLMAMVLAGLVLLAYGPLLAAHAQFMWARDHYKYFPVVPLFTAFLVWDRFPTLPRFRPNAGWFTWAVVGLAILQLAMAILVDSYWLGAVSFLFLLLGAMIGVGGNEVTWQLFPCWLFCWMAIPLPARYDETLIVRLQFITAEWSSSVLDVLYILHDMKGNIVQIPGQKLLVEEACSGIHSLYAAVTLTLFYTIWNRRGFWHSTLLVGSAVGWVLAANVLRVVGIVTLGVKGGWDIKEGPGHEMYGLAIFAFEFLTILSTDRLLLFLRPKSWRRDWEESENDAPQRTLAELVPNLDRTWITTPIVSACLLALVGLEGWLMIKQERFMPEAIHFTLPKQEAASIAPPKGWEFVNFEESERTRDHILGEYSQTWHFKTSGHRAAVSLDYPFFGWHDLTNCYRGAGWSFRPEDFKIVEPTNPSAENADPPYVACSMRHSIDKYGYLIFNLHSRKGVALQPQQGIVKNLSWRLASFAKITGGVAPYLAAREEVDIPSYQVQLFIESFRPLTADEQKQARTFFLETTKGLGRDYSSFEMESSP